MSNGYAAKEIMISVLLEFHTQKDEVVEKQLKDIGVTLFKKSHQLVGFSGSTEFWMGNCPLSALQDGQLAALPSIGLAWIGLEGPIKTILLDSRQDK